MTKQEIELMEVKEELQKLILEVKAAEKWVTYSKDTINVLREKLFNLEEKNNESHA